MDKIINFRPLASRLTTPDHKRIKEKIFRCGNPFTMSEGDARRLKALEIETILDFRSRDEKSSDMTRWYDEFEVECFDVMGHGQQNDFQSFMKASKKQVESFMMDLYGIQLPGSTHFKDAMKRVMAQEGRPFMFNCTAGKDRTGTFAAVLMLLLGFDEADIKKEYLLLDERFIQGIRHQISLHFGMIDEALWLKIEPALTVKETYIEAFLEGILKSYKDYETYFQQGLGMTPTAINQLRAYYLEEA